MWAWQPIPALGRHFPHPGALGTPRRHTPFPGPTAIRLPSTVPRPTTSLCLAAALAWIARPSLAAAQEAPPPEPPEEEGAPEWMPPTFPIPGVLDPAKDAAAPVIRRSGETTWLDYTHEFVETRLFAPILRLDRFFSDERYLEEERARSFVRWRNELRLDNEARPAFATGVRASLRLPGLNRYLRRLRVVIAGGTREAFDAIFPDDPAQEGTTLGAGNAELRFNLFDAVGSHADVGAGLLFRYPVGVFVRTGLRWRLVAGDLFVARLGLSGFWRTDTRFGTRASGRLERPLGPATLVRVGSEVLLTEVSHGVEWTPSTALIRAFGPRAGISLGAAAVWKSADIPHIERYRVSLRLRRDIYRRWLFVELEPEVYWPWTPAQGRHAAVATTLRFEVQFSGNAPVDDRENAMPPDDER